MGLKDLGVGASEERKSEFLLAESVAFGYCK